MAADLLSLGADVNLRNKNGRSGIYRHVYCLSTVSLYFKEVSAEIKTGHFFPVSAVKLNFGLGESVMCTV